MILLRRLFSRRPGPQEMEFHWWFLTCGGINEWHRYLASKGFIFSRRNRIIRGQEKTAMQVLEVWDTERFYQWKHNPRQHPVIEPQRTLTPDMIGLMSGAGDWDDHDVHMGEIVHASRPTTHEPDHHHHDYWSEGPSRPELPAPTRKTLPHSHI